MLLATQCLIRLVLDELGCILLIIKFLKRKRHGGHQAKRRSGCYLVIKPLLERKSSGGHQAKRRKEEKT
jgi:hypothetical protein